MVANGYYFKSLESISTSNGMWQLDSGRRFLFKKACVNRRTKLPGSCVRSEGAHKLSVATVDAG